MAQVIGIEPTTARLTAERYFQLSYTCVIVVFFEFEVLKKPRSKKLDLIINFVMNAPLGLALEIDSKILMTRDVRVFHNANEKYLNRIMGIVEIEKMENFLSN